MRSGANINRIQSRARMASADGPVNGWRPLPSSLHRATPHSRKAGLAGPSLLSILPRQSSQDPRRVSVLRLSRPFAAFGSPQVFVRTYPHSPLEAYADHVRHLSVLKSAGTRLARVGVFQ